MRDETLTRLLTCLLRIAIGGLLILIAILIVRATARPVVSLTWPARACVRVEPASAGSCADLPTRYEIQWVAPAQKEHQR